MTLAALLAFGCADGDSSGEPDASGERSDTAAADGGARPGRPDAEPPPPPDDAGQSVTLRIGARIDGRSRIILSGMTAQWQHFDNAAPGRHEGQDLPTVINGVDWLPLWPSTGENRNCNCSTQPFEFPFLLVPRTPVTVDLVRVQARRGTSVIQAPTADNDFTLIVEINDNDAFGSADYVIDVTLAALP